MRPMFATAGDLPIDPGWAFELKWDGVRALVEITDGHLAVIGRGGKPMPTAYPELAGLGERIPDALLDGEIVAFVDGRPSFRALQDRIGIREEAVARRAMATRPVTLLVFDVLRLGDEELFDRPYRDRRALLDGLELAADHWLVPPVFDDGPATMAASAQHGLEGVVAKRLAGKYRPGTRSHDWIKVKAVVTQDCVVGGWAAGKGERTGAIGSLLLGIPDPDGTLRYVGRVGSGVAGPALAELTRLLTPAAIPQSPFAGEVPAGDGRRLHWCEPRYVVEVAYASWTSGGRMWHPRFQRLRLDKTYDDVREQGAEGLPAGVTPGADEGVGGADE